MRILRMSMLTVMVQIFAGCSSFPDKVTGVEVNCGNPAQLSRNIDTLMNAPFIWLKSYAPFNNEPMTAKYSLLTLNQQE